MSRYRITADLDHLVKDAMYGVSDFFRSAVKDIDAEFGNGYAKEHPELVASLVRCATDDWMRISTTAIAQGWIDDLIGHCGEAATGIGSIGSGLSALSDSLDALAKKSG